jgi:hypothetical protein
LLLQVVGDLLERQIMQAELEELVAEELEKLHHIQCLDQVFQ